MAAITIKNVMNIVTICLCLTGLLFQLSMIADRYFKFQTRSEVQLSIPHEISTPQVSSCWFLQDIMKGKGFKSKLDYYEKLNEMSIKEIFESTPPTDYILNEKQACTIRFPHQLAARKPYPNRIECMKMFTIEKYIQRDFICYKFELVAIDPKNKLSITEYSLSPQAPGLIYRIWMNNSIFRTVDSFTAFTHSKSTSDLHDSMFSRYLWYKTDLESKVSDLIIDVTYSRVTLKRLESPFDTACRNFYPYSSSNSLLYQKMNEETMKVLHRVNTFYPVKNHTLKHQMVNAHALRNDIFLEEYNEIFKKYNVSYLDCFLSYYVSKVSISFGDMVTVGVFWPQDSRIKMEQVPNIELIDFLLYVCSSFGIWIGVSVLSIGQTINGIIGWYSGRKNSTEENIIHPNEAILRLEASNKRLESTHKRLNRSVRTSLLAMIQYMKLRFEMIENRFDNFNISKDYSR